MPFTPFHLGPGLLVKALMQGSFSLMVFGWAQIIMDLQPLMVILTGVGHMHGFSHTYLGATLIGLFSALTGKYIAELGLRIVDMPNRLPVSWPVAMVSGFIGSYSHVLLDSLTHLDLQPFAPFALNNPFLGFISLAGMHKVCVYSGIIGGGLYFAIAHWLSRRDAAPKRNS